MKEPLRGKKPVIDSTYCPNVVYIVINTDTVGM
jgi:hypothetical protein